MVRRLLLLLAATLLLVGSSLVVDPAHADPAASIDDSGWWWRAQTNPEVLLPPPPNTKEGQLLVQSSPEGATALAAIAGTLVEGQASPVLTLAVADGGDVGSEGAVILACQAGSTWKGGDAKPWAEHPQAGCDAGGVPGTRSEDGTSWTFDLSSLQFSDKVNVVIVPGAVDGQPEGANHSAFSVTFEAPTPASLATTPGSAVSSPPPLDIGGGVVDPGVGAGVVDSYSPPADSGTSLELPPVAAALPEEDQGLTPVAPSVQAGQPLLPASMAIDPRSPHARSVGVVLLLLGGALVYFLTRQQHAIGPDGIPGGLGRWAAPRWGTPPSLRG
ncbi:MAG: hypothetical protein ACJ739_14100 [Acidimicrobiales bacterium]